MIDYINWLYSFPSLPDLLFDDALASIQGNYVSVSMAIKNHGLRDSYLSEIIILADGKQIKDFDLEEIPAGGGRIIRLTNIFVTRSNINEIEFYIKSNYEELDKSNNQIILKIKDKN